MRSARFCERTGKSGFLFDDMDSPNVLGVDTEGLISCRNRFQVFDKNRFL
jgi:hypothetical protein